MRVFRYSLPVLRERSLAQSASQPAYTDTWTPFTFSGKCQVPGVSPSCTLYVRTKTITHDNLELSRSWTRLEHGHSRPSHTEQAGIGYLSSLRGIAEQTQEGQGLRVKEQFPLYGAYQRARYSQGLRARKVART